ncbi:hypothetical protein ONE63_007356 [Megalurothrips usitatus]|uniref:Peptidase S1 domain-containing protein n=1 Tax=Megalurothrips usitatus TaxID=439358 RepID=A0AAV7XWQ8_9NEOP|nr:hypothetical protein ONE63_007356 [Megalurothrips usitatus]
MPPASTTTLLAALCLLAAARCGRLSPPGRLLRGSGGRIVGGEVTTIDKLPYQVALEFWGAQGCGGAILTSTHVLTAAHCTDGESASSMTIRAGSSVRGVGGTVRRVVDVLQHPEYNAKSTDYDLSVLVLEADLPSNDRGIAAITLVVDAPPEGALGTVSGWGDQTEGGNGSSQLRFVQVPKVSEADCKEALGDSAITDRMTCYGAPEGGKDSCQGDSGGPLAVGGALAGIVSWGVGCGDAGYPGVYADLINPELRSFIEDGTGLDLQEPRQRRGREQDLCCSE